MKKEEYARLNPTKIALAAGILSAASLFITTLLSMWGIFGKFPTIISLIAEVYGIVGYNTTFFGAIMGSIGIFIDTFICFWIFALLYNKLIN